MAPGKRGKKRNISEELVQSAVQPSPELQQNDPVESSEQVRSANDLMQSPQEANQDSLIQNAAVDSIPSTKVRGPTRGIGLEKFIKGKNKMVIDIPSNKGRPVCEVQSAKLSSEIGIITRQFMPVPTKWRDMKNTEKLHAFERLNTKFEMKLDDEAVKKSILSILSKLSRNERYKLHLHYKKFPNAEVACQNNPPKYNLSQENWEKLCDLFSDPAYKRRCETNAKSRSKVKLTHNQGSRAFVASRYSMRNDDQEPNRMEFFKATHYSEEKGWSTPEAQAAYEKMVELESTPTEEGTEPKTIDAIVDEVLGTRSGYIKGLGYGPKPTKNNSKENSSELKETLKKTQDELQDYKSKFGHFESQIEAMKNALIAAGIQVPISQSSVSSDTNSQSMQSPSTQELD